MKKSFLITILSMLIVSCSSHPNLDSEVVIMNEEDKKNVANYKNPIKKVVLDGKEITIKIDDRQNTTNNFKKIADSVKVLLFEKLKSKSELNYEDKARLIIYTPRKQILKVLVPFIPKFSIEIRSFNVNKRITSVDELILAKAYFMKAFFRNMNNGTWYFENEKIKYSDTIFNQFRYTNIKSNKFYKIDEVLDYYF
jgi:hypothetical protein